MILFRILRWLVYLIVIFIILLLIIRVYEKHKVKNALYRNYDGKVIALTFDDGPVTVTKDIVDMLDTAGVKATFFVLGDEAARRPEILKYTHDHGHVIANHTWNHPYFLGFTSRDYIEYQLDKTDMVIRDTIGQSTTFVRTPFGLSSPWLNKILKGRGVTNVHWTLSPQDWHKDSTKERLVAEFKHIQKSQVILLHDRVYSDPEKLQALEEAIIDLKDRGFMFVTIPELYR